jgi:hypothetical protein
MSGTFVSQTQVINLLEIGQDYLMNKSIPAADPAMKSHHDIDISFNFIYF